MIAQLPGSLSGWMVRRLFWMLAGSAIWSRSRAGHWKKLASRGDQLTLLTSLQVREDSMTLFGFAEAAEQEAFHFVQTVQGVGAKAALALLSVLGPQDLYQAILAGDKAMVARAEGDWPETRPADCQ